MQESVGLDETRLLAERHFGAAGRPGSYVKPFTRSKGSKFEGVQRLQEVDLCSCVGEIVFIRSVKVNFSDLLCLGFF